MRLLSLTVVPAVLIATASLGAGWESGMVEDEGGPVMQAWVLADDGDVPPELRMMCGDEVMLRYGQGTSLGEGVEPIRSSPTLVLSVPPAFTDGRVQRRNCSVTSPRRMASRTSSLMSILAPPRRTRTHQAGAGVMEW